MPRLVLIMMTAGLLTAGYAHAQTETTLVPSVTFGSTYDDNLFARTTGDAGTMTIMRPALEANYASPRLNASSLFSFDLQHSNFPALSTIDARRHGNVDVRHRTTQALTLAIGVRYDRTETPGELNLDSGVLGERQIADRWEAVPSLAYRTTTRTTITASYNGMTETLVNDIRGILHVARAGVAHQVSAHDELTVGYLGRRFVDAFDTRTSHAVLAGWSRALDYATHFTLQAGPRVSAADRKIDAEIVAGVTRTTNHSRIGVDYWHGETMILGIHGPVKIDTATAKLVWPVTPRAEIGVNTGITDSTSLLNQNVRVLQAVLVGAWTPHGGAYTFSASYGAERQHGILIGGLFFDDQVVRHTLRVNVTIAPRLSRKFRPTGELPVVHAQGDSQ